MKMVFISLMSIMISCGSSSPTTSDELSGVNNEDFLPKSEVIYNVQKDYYLDDFTQIDSLGNETVAKMSTDKIQKFESSEDILLQGISLCYAGKQSRGLKKLRNIYSYYKKNSSYWNQVGTCFLLKGNKRMALLFYNKARGLSKKFTPSYNNLGVIYQLNSEDQKALVAYKKAKKVNPFSLTPNFNIAQLYLQYGFVQDAKKILDGLFNNETSDIDIQSARAFILMSQGNFQEAKSTYETIPRQQFSKAQFGINYALTLKFLNLDAQARSIIKNINRKTLSEYTAYYNNARIFIGE